MVPLGRRDNVRPPGPPPGPRYPTIMANASSEHPRITSDPGIVGGKPCVRGMRLSVQQVLQILADYGEDWEATQRDYPALEREDVPRVLAFAAKMLEDRFMPLDPGSSAA